MIVLQPFRYLNVAQTKQNAISQLKNILVQENPLIYHTFQAGTFGLILCH